MQVLALTDDKPGNRTQTLGVAEALGAPFTELRLHPTAFSALPNAVLNHSLLGYTAADRAALRTALDASPGVILAAGRRLIPALRAAKHACPQALAVYLMHPHGALHAFDLAAIPAHDAPPIAPNVIATTGAPHRLNASALAHARDAGTARFGHLPAPRIAVLVGGDAKGCRYTATDWQRFAEAVTHAAVRWGGSLLVTTSPRTGAEATEILARALPSHATLHKWQPHGDNPYLPMLACADAILVTGESMSMLSEACAVGVPVFVFSPNHPLPAKYRAFQQQLQHAGYAQPLTSTSALDWQPPAPLNEAQRIADWIRRHGRPYAAS